MNVLLIGGTGNLSADFAAALHEQGHTVGVVTRGQSPVPAHYRSVIADRRDLRAMREALRGFAPEVVVNFLGFQPEDVEADLELFAGRVTQYVFISSATVYAKPPPRLPIAEDCPLGNAYWDYARAKIACEERLRRAFAETGFPITIVRPSHTYSRRWVPNPFGSSAWNFAARIERGLPVVLPDTGETRWTLTAASDFAVGLAGLIGNARAIGEAVHITSEEALPWREIYAGIATALGVETTEVVPVPTEFICRVVPRLTGPLKGDKSHPGIFDNAKLRGLVPGFQCRKPFREGIAESVAWLRAHPEQWRLDPTLDAEMEAILAAWAKP